MMSINIVSSEANITKIATIAGGAAAAAVFVLAVAAYVYCKRRAKRSASSSNVRAFNDIPFAAPIHSRPLPNRERDWREASDVNYGNESGLEGSYASTVDEDPSSFYAGRWRWRQFVSMDNLPVVGCVSVAVWFFLLVYVFVLTSVYMWCGSFGFTAWLASLGIYTRKKKMIREKDTV